MAADFTIHVGDNRETLKAIPDASCHVCICSPPYFQLRRYGDGSRRDVEHGAEGTLDEHIAVLVEVFREVRRVLHPSGTLWLNYGDRSDGKQLQGMPWRVAFALQADGWWLRSDVVWNKPAPMPESVTDRPTRSHEYLFLLAKAPRYYYDNEAVKEKSSGAIAGNTVMGKTPDCGNADTSRRATGLREAAGQSYPTRNIRDVWTIAAEPTKYAHFAAFPRKLVEPCVKAGTSEKGCCPACFAPWERVVEKTSIATRERGTEPSMSRANLQGPQQADVYAISRTVGWRPTCTCSAGDPIPCTVLDPYCGTGRTGAVAVAHGRRFIGCELYPAYADYARGYIANPDPMPVETQVEGQLDLFD